jgi:exoribonuclease-2
MNQRRPRHRSTLRDIATEAMFDRGLEPEFSRAVQQQVDAMDGPARADNDSIIDLTSLPWCSIDNDDSRDLDQLSVAEDLGGGVIKVLVAIADVDALVKIGTPIDDHAQQNTTSIYTAARIFPMLPERLSTDLTSLNVNEDRLAVVTEMVFAADGSLTTSRIYRATVRNQAQLAYDATSVWLESDVDAPASVKAIAGVEAHIRLQDAVAQKLRQHRHEHGALDLETITPKAVFEDDDVVDVRLEPRNRGRQLIEDLMIATNGVTARFLADHKFASLRRVVRSPERWLRIVDVARDLGEHLPPVPDSKALEDFMVKRRRADPLRFPDLSLIIVKLMGSGEYVVEKPGATAIGHFGLAVRDYTHSTAPNRRYPDLISQRLVKAALAGDKAPYQHSELQALADHCTARENDADKVERRVRKSAAALLLENRIGERFDAVVTGASDKGVWVRILAPPVEGKVVDGARGLDVGQKITVKLMGSDVDRGFIDFARVT